MDISIVALVISVIALAVSVDIHMKRTRKWGENRWDYQKIKLTTKKQLKNIENTLRRWENECDAKWKHYRCGNRKKQ